RRRLGLIAAVAVAVAVAIAALVCYLVVRGQLRGEVDGELRAQATAVAQGDLHTLGRPLPGLPASAGGPAPYVQVVLADGSTIPRLGEITLPDGARASRVAAGLAAPYLRDLHVGATHLRELTFPVPVSFQGQSVAVQLARPLNGTDRVLAHLRLILLLLCAGGTAVAAALGRLAARRVLAPLAEVAQTAQRIGETDDLSHRLRIHADDEVGQLAARFNHMLERLEASRAELDDSVRAQRQLVADASHELRTPVTSLRTNIEVLLEGGELDPEDRRRLLADVVEQSEELSHLVGDLIELARGDLPPEGTEAVRLDRIVEEALARAQRNAPSVQFLGDLEPVVLDGAPERLARAVNNLLDNAGRHAPPGGSVEVTLNSRGVRVRDHGSGVPEQDLPYVFDRFFRGASARGRQGSGLGLAIVRQVAEQHGGSAAAENAPDGGAVFRLLLPATTLATDLSAPRRPRHAGLAGAAEPTAEQPEEQREDGHHGQQHDRPLARLPEQRGDGDGQERGGDPRQQGGVGAKPGEVLAGGDLQDAQDADGQAHDQRGTAALHEAHRRSDHAGEDGDLRNR
ncbi:MAG: HAMP domain-containing histidine kinase, partial [Actinomycetota bacterium]|nr:HAMP domain-containing histidine kinase [Actinomycetota bacterium]